MSLDDTLSQPLNRESGLDWADAGEALDPAALVDTGDVGLTETANAAVGEDSEARGAGIVSENGEPAAREDRPATRGAPPEGGT